MLMGIARAYPWIGIITALVLGGLGAAVLANKLPRSPLGKLFAVPPGRRSSIRWMASADLGMALLLLIIGIGALTARYEAVERALVARRAAEEEAQRNAERQKVLMAQLAADVPAAIERSKAALDEIAALLEARRPMQEAKVKGDAALADLRRHDAVAAGNPEFVAVTTRLSNFLEVANKSLRSDAAFKEILDLVNKAAALVKAGQYIEADDAYSAALVVNEKLASEDADYAKDNLSAKLAGGRQWIAKKVQRARAKLAAEERKRTLQFRLGNFYYWIDEPAFKRCIGNSFTNTCAGAGATFVIVPYTIQNMGNETQTVVKGDFELQDSAGRTFRASSEVETTLLMSGGSRDFILSELHPGVQRTLKTGFEIPSGATGLKLVVPEKGILGFKRREIPLN
jgi:tetratricopeptide (TPR) repeat protein